MGLAALRFAFACASTSPELCRSSLSSDNLELRRSTRSPNTLRHQDRRWVRSEASCAATPPGQSVLSSASNSSFLYESQVPKQVGFLGRADDHRWVYVGCIGCKSSLQIVQCSRKHPLKPRMHPQYGVSASQEPDLRESEDAGDRRFSCPAREESITLPILSYLIHVPIELSHRGAE